MPSADSLLATVRAAFQENGWVYEEVPGRPVIESGFEAHHGRIHLHVQVYGELHAVSVVCAVPARLETGAARAKVAELLMRANERLNLGGFELRWDTGEVLFRIGNVFPGDAAEPGVISLLVEIAIVEMDRIVPCLGLIASASPARMVLLDAAELLQREDLLPPVTPPEGRNVGKNRVGKDGGL